MHNISGKILIVGGAGFVGSNLCHALLNASDTSLVVVDNLLSADAKNLPINDRLQFVYGSITDDRILSKIGNEFDYVFHLATFHGNQSSIHDPITDHANNTFTTLKLCEHFKNSIALKKMVYSSAGCTVAKKTFADVDATDENADVSLYHDSPYQISKIIGEFYGNYYWMKHALPFVKARFQNVYGPREILGAGLWRGTSATIWRNVIPTFIWKALHHEALPLENGGVATRDFIFVNDIVQGLIACAAKGKNGEVYNLASGIETSIMELATLINKITNNPIAPAVMPARSWDRSGKRFGATTKAADELNFVADTSLADGLAATVAWTRENKNLILSNMRKHCYFNSEVENYA